MKIIKSSKYVGVRFVKSTKRWQAIIKIDSVSKSLGMYATEIEAAIVADKARIERGITKNGKCNRLNFSVDIKPYNPIPNTELIKGTLGQWATVNDFNYEWLNQYQWSCAFRNGTYYFSRSDRSSGKKKTIMMHREILGITDPNIHVDHINHNGGHNYLPNIRPCSVRQNAHNRKPRKGCTSDFKGVVYLSKWRKYRVLLKPNGVSRYGGLFDTEIDAAHKANEIMIEYQQDFAWLNKDENGNIL